MLSLRYHQLPQEFAGRLTQALDHSGMPFAKPRIALGPFRVGTDEDPAIGHGGIAVAVGAELRGPDHVRASRENVSGRFSRPTPCSDSPCHPIEANPPPAGRLSQT